MAVSKRTSKASSRGRNDPASDALPSWIRWARWVMPLIALLIVGAFAAAKYGIPGIKSVPRDFKEAGIVNNRPPAADFTLTNQFGQPESLSSFRGKPVALTFIYTNCVDVCPLIAWNMHLAYDQLGNDAKNIALVAVSV